jgi:hypothetical protein
MEKANIIKSLKKGDRTTIAEITGFSADYVKKVLSFKRNSDTIWLAAKQIVKQRQDLKQKFNATPKN